MAPMICDSFFQSSAAATKRRCSNVVDRTAAEDVPTNISQDSLFQDRGRGRQERWADTARNNTD